MATKLAVRFAASALLGLPALGQAGMPNVNRVANAGFEYKVAAGPDGDIPLYWSAHAFPGGYGSFTVARFAACHGTNGVEIADGSATAGWGLESDAISVEPGSVYTLRSWYRRESGAGNSLRLSWYDSGGGSLGSQGTSSSSSAWSLLSVTATAPAGAASARVLLESGVTATGAGWFDSVSLVLADERIHDGGFDAALPGLLPVHWTVESSHAGSVQEARFDELPWIGALSHPLTGPPPWGGNVVLALQDVSTTESCGVSYVVPVTPDTPYRLSLRARRSQGTGSASVTLELLDASQQLLSAHSAATSSRTFEQLEIASLTDPGAAYARIRCHSEPASSGAFRFDDVSLGEDYTRLYASPDGAGLMDGSSPGNAADYDDGSFWSGVVNPAAVAQPVRVVLLAGEYRDHLELYGLGDPVHHTLIEGETPFAVRWSDGGGSTDEYCLIHDCQNYRFRHLHFTSDNAEQMQYVLRIGLIGSVGENTEEIAVQGCSFVGITHMYFGMTGAHRHTTHDVTWEYSSWVEIGADAPDHMIYNAYGAHDLWIHHNYFQDCGGAYVKFRDECHDSVVENNTFVCTGTVGETPNIYLIYSSANNSVSTYDELLPYDIVIRNNSFTYDDVTAAGSRIPLVMKMEGDEPSQHPGWYLISTADGQYIADTSNRAENRNAKIVENCHIDLMGGDFQVYGNTYVNCHDIRFWFWRKTPPPGDYWVGLADIDALLGL